MRLLVSSIDGESRSYNLEDELTIGRSASARITVDDPSISRLHATIWLEDGKVWITDENSTNGTYVNGKRIFEPTRITENDEIKLGFNTFIRIEAENNLDQKPNLPNTTLPKTGFKESKSQTINPQIIFLTAGALAFLIIFSAFIAILIAKHYEDRQSTPTIITGSSLSIPVRVIDPLGGEDPEDLDDLIASWEVEEKELRAEDLSEISTETSELNVSVSFWQRQRSIALAPRNGPTGIIPEGLQVPPELFGDGVVKQKAKLAQMLRLGYQQPMDFADLAQKKLNKELIELPMATESFFLDVGGSATEEPFTSFSFDTGEAPIIPGTPKFEVLKRLAENFDGQRYDLNNPRDRKQMRIRLLRMFHPKAKPILKEIADAYFRKFGRPLRVTSLTRSMDYQIALNRTNPNSFRVRGAGSLPPHTSGCAFDLARKHMTAEEQNFLMQKLAEMERRGLIDALIEYNQNACFHIFVYPDGKPP
ncbi:MAG: DUF5715 family protein [Pyrinomonadaceae bacterium]|nr:DUF5715 family protein [Pyrinomonadaceae bacterium]